MRGYLLPWKRPYDNTPPYYICRFKFGSIHGWSVWRDRNAWVGSGLGSNRYQTAEEAMAAIDKYLIEQGYYLIPDDEVERFEKKLKLLL